MRFCTFIFTIFTISSVALRMEVECLWNHKANQPLRTLKLSADVLSKVETNKFMLYAYEKMGWLNCVTFIWDSALSHIIESLSVCLPRISACSAYKYQFKIKSEGFEVENNTSHATLKSGYQRQCGGYIILIRNLNMVTDFLHEGDAMKLINTRAKFLIWYEDNDKKFESDEIWKKITNVVLFHSKTKKTDSRGGGGNRVLFTVRGIRWPVIQNTTETRTRVIEFWNYNGTDTEPSNQEWFYDKTTDWKKSTLRIVVVDHPPGVLKSVSPNREVEYSGTEIELVKALSIIMNFNYEFIDADSTSKWGGQEEVNSTQLFVGSVARLIYGETDMAIGSFFILKHYLEYIDMSVPLDVVCTSFLTPKSQQRPRFLALIVPFRLELWILILVICLLIGPLTLFALTRLGHVENREHAIFYKRIHTVLTSFRIMSQVAIHIWPKTWPIRVYIGFYWIFWLLITICYRSTMVSFLTIPLFEKPIDNFGDLVKSGLRIGGWGSELQRLFTEHETSSNENVYRDILVKKYEIIDDLDMGISMVAGGTFALYENIRFLRFMKMTRNLTRVGAPSMRIMKLCIVPVHIGFAFQKNSAITHTMNRFIRRFQESGLMNKWGQRLIAIAKQYNNRKLTDDDDGKTEESVEDSEDTDDSSNSYKSREPKVLAIRDLQGSLYLLALGIALSVIVFIAELIWSKWVFPVDKANIELKRLVDKTKLIIEDRVLIKNGKKKKRTRKRKLKKKAPFPFPYTE